MIKRDITRKIIAFLLAAILIVPSSVTFADEAQTEGGDQNGADAEITIAYQYGLGYAPITIAQQQGLIENAYKEATGAELEVTWVQMSSGADINTGIAAGEIDAGVLGVGPTISGIAKKLGYKIFSNVTGQEHGIMVNTDDIQSFDDLIGSDYQIALVNIGSIQHILLAETLAAKGYDPHALDANLIAMKHPDGMAALFAGTVAAQVTTNPYLYQEREDDSLHEIEEMSETCDPDNSFLVGIVSEAIHDEEPDVYDALVKGVQDGIDYVNNNLEDTAKITCEFDGNDEETELRYLKKGTYQTETKGIEDMAKFMYENGFLDDDPGEYEDLVFDNVTGD